jgi:hypothetical protein
MYSYGSTRLYVQSAPVLREWKNLKEDLYHFLYQRSTYEGPNIKIGGGGPHIKAGRQMRDSEAVVPLLL